MSDPATTHASSVLAGETGVLIRGPSGSGKSTLAHALIVSDPGGTRLVADDRVILDAVNGRLIADVPATLAGLIELRGLGILRMPYIAPVRIHLVVDLVSPQDCQRLPEPDEIRVEIAGIGLARLALPIGVADGAVRVREAIGQYFD